MMSIRILHLADLHLGASFLSMGERASFSWTSASISARAFGPGSLVSLAANARLAPGDKIRFKAIARKKLPRLRLGSFCLRQESRHFRKFN